MRYKAFISYSHSGDSQLAPALQSALRRIGKPWYRRAPFRIFLDKSSLAANPALWNSIETALGESEYLLLLASTSSARSEWVEREVDWWLTHRGAATILVLLTEGDVEWRPGDQDFDWKQTTALSERLQARFHDEPLWVDLRWARNERRFSLRQGRWRDSVLQVAPALYGKSRDDLDDEDVRYYRSARRMAICAAIVLAVLIVGVLFATRTAREQREVANCRELAAQAAGYLDTQLDLALLLGVESSRQSSCTEGRSVLLSALQRRPHLAGFLSGHTNEVIDLAYSPDGRMVGSSSWDQSVKLWDMATRKPLGPVLKGMYGLSFRPDGKMLASADGEAVTLWTIPGGKPEVKLHFARGYEVDRVAFNADGRVLATSNEPNGMTPSAIFLWDVATQQRSATIRGQAFAFSPDGKTMATDSEDGKSVVIRDARTQKVLGPPLEGGTARVIPIAFSRDDRMLAAGRQDGSVNLWDLEGRQSRVLTGHHARINAVAFSPDGAVLASGSGDGTVVLWDVERAQAIKAPLTVSERPVSDLAFSPDGHALLSTSSTRVVIWDLARVLQISRDIKMEHEANSGLAFSPDGKVLAFLDNYNQVIFLNAQTGAVMEDGIGERVTSVAFSPDNSQFATVSFDGHFVLWNRETGETIGKEEETHFRLFSAGFSPDGRTIAVGGDSVLLLWDTKGRRWIARITGQQKDRISGIAFSPDGKLVASAGNSSFGLWDAKTGSAIIAPVRTDPKPKYLIHADVAFSKDGRLLAYREGPDGVVLWDVANRRQVGRSLTGQRGVISSIAFTPDGKLLATGSSYGSIALWDVQSRMPIGPPFDGMGSEVNSLAVSPDGRLLAAIVDKGISILDIHEESWRKTACKIANRNLTREEWTRIFGSAVSYRETCSFAGSSATN